MDTKRENAKVLEIKDLKISFNSPEGVVKALDGVNLDLYDRETLGIVGETGCGKSVTTKAIMGLIEYPGKIDGGSIKLLDREIIGQSEKFLESIRGKVVSMIFQEPAIALNPVLSLGHQISEVFQQHQITDIIDISMNATNVTPVARMFLKRLQKNKDDKLTKIANRIPWLNAHKKILQDEIESRVGSIMDLVRISETERVYHTYPHQLSGGMMQRFMIATAVSCKPRILIADEPTSSLDVSVGTQILDLIDKLKTKLNTSIILITHDLGIVAKYADRVSVMYAGSVVETASTRKIFRESLHPYTQLLLKCIPTEKKGKLQIIPGTVPNLVNPPSGCRFHQRCPRPKDICSTKKPKLIEMTPDHFVACFE